MKKFFFIILIWIVFFIPKNTLAVPAYPGTVAFRNADGSSVSIKLYGDENFHRVESVDGYTLLMNDVGFYEYAMKNDQGDIVPSGITPHDSFDRTPREIDLRSKTVPHLMYTHEQLNILRQIKRVYAAEQERPQQAFPTTGSRKLICILMGFSDLAFSK
ncbi:MAG: hypothetical protein D3924_18610, partial [Candidatus Electrothrix sp. AR4]|nr:hypothetical protein [Candidatus Electrothrix sp. AR4]